MVLGRLSVYSRFLLVLGIGFVFTSAMSVGSLFFLKRSLVEDRTTEVKHLLEAAYSTVVFYHGQAVKGLMTDADARRAAADAVRAMHYDGSNYFFIWDLNGTSIAHGAQPALEGRTFIDSVDAQRNPTVAFMVKRLIAVAKSDSKQGITTYRIPKKGLGTPLDKITYSRLFEPWGWSIGTGAYLDDIDELFRIRALSVLELSIVLIVLAGGITFVLGRDLVQSLNRLSRQITRVAKGELDGDIRDVSRADEVGEMARALLVLRDTSREAAELRLDQLTGLPTRKLLTDRLKQVTARGARSGNHSALMLVDLDNFKTINDTYGHDVGDLVLREVAERLTATVREGDTVGRLGGDEFVVILVDIGKNENQAIAAAEAIGNKLLQVLQQPIHFGGVVHAGTASIGVTLFQGDGSASAKLMKQADLAMYKSKDSGRNECRFFDAHMEATVNDRAMLETELSQAIHAEQFELFYQAQVGPDGLDGAEALIRWNHPSRGLVPPSDFIQLAEETGLILRLGEWVLERACKQLASWAANRDMSGFTIAVNVSPRQFRQHDFVQQVIATLRRTGADPRRLTLELTESMLIHSVADVIEKMRDLKSEGVSFALDDFGIAYSSLNLLKRLPLDQIKIDRSFVRHVLTEPIDAAIARMIVALGTTLGLEVLAEGIETFEQRDFLSQAGCYRFQGYLFSRPLPPASFEAFAALQIGPLSLQHGTA